jgi:CubicO group peptidase (beta-lactamase class C family)
MNNIKLIESSYLARYIFLNTVDILDYNVFPEREIQNAPPCFHFSSPEDIEAVHPFLDRALASTVQRSQTETIDQFLERNGTVAFLLIRNDTLLLERYYNGYDHSSICTSFSTVKSFVSAMVGIALHEGLIHDLDDPITNYLPELTAPHWSVITLRHLISMSSGLKYNPNGFFPWNDEPRVYYSLDLRELARSARREEAPGLHFHYNNYNLVLLGMILERITGNSVSEYLQEKIWKPLGMEFPASWSLDSQHSGMEKMESGLNAPAIDFAKFGRLYLRRGDWNGKQIIPESWIAESTTIEPDAKWTNYKYLWWVPRSGKGRFMAVGNLGQFIYVAPDKDCLILRFGRGRPRNWQRIYPQLFGQIMELL